MPAVAAYHQLISVEDYLASELTSETKWEYIAGSVYPMDTDLVAWTNRHF